MSEGPSAKKNEAAVVQGLIRSLVPATSSSEEASDELVTVSKLDEVTKACNAKMWIVKFD